jgi:hypothetical protein
MDDLDMSPGEGQAVSHLIMPVKRAGDYPNSFDIENVVLTLGVL